MTTRTTETKPSEDDWQAIRGAADAADVVQNKIQDMADGVVAGTLENPLGDNLAAALAALWGNSLCETYGWEWIVPIHGDWRSLGVADRDRKYLALPFNLFSRIIDEARPGRTRSSPVESHRIRPANMIVDPCGLPAASSLDRAFVARAFFADSYRVPLKHPDASVVDIFFAVFGHHPAWLKALLLVRHRVGSWFGLEAASTAEVMHPSKAASYRVGQNIGTWPIFLRSEGELIAGRDNKHLDFRLSVLKQAAGQSAYAVVSTVCVAHNWFGRLYLRVVAPFHTWGIRRLLRRAVEENRL
jgi:hypothetical protein